MNERSRNYRANDEPPTPAEMEAARAAETRAVVSAIVAELLDGVAASLEVEPDLWWTGAAVARVLHKSADNLRS